MYYAPSDAIIIVEVGALMRIFSLYVIREIAYPACLSFLIFNVLALMGITYRLHTLYPELLSPQFVLFIPSLLPEVLYSTFPLAVLVGSITAANRLEAENEFDVLRMMGRSLCSLLPVLLSAAAFAGVSYFFFVAYVVPHSYYARREYPCLVARSFSSVLDLLQDRRINLPGCCFSFSRREGHTVYDLVLAKDSTTGGFLLRAESADCEFCSDKQTLALALHIGSFVSFDRQKSQVGNCMSFRHAQISLNLAPALSASKVPSRYQTLSALLLQLRAVSSAKGKRVVKPDAKPTLEQAKISAELWSRVADGLRIPVCLIFGMCLGMAFRKRRLVEAITVGVILGATFHEPFRKLATKLVVTGIADAWWATEVSNVGLLALSGVVLLIGKRGRP